MDATNLQELPGTGTAPATPAAPAASKPSASTVSQAKQRPVDEEEDDKPARSRRRNEEEEEEKPARSRRRNEEEEEEKPARSRRRNEEEEEEKPARSRRRNEEEEEETPRSRRRNKDDEEEENEAPRSRRRSKDDEEEEATPRSRRRSKDDEEENEAPRSKRRSKDDEDDDEKPRSRRRSKDDEDDDDYESPRRRKKKKKGNKGMMIGMIAGGVIVAGLLIWLMISLFGGGSYDKEMMSYMPSDAIMIAGVDVEELMGIELVKGKADEAMKSMPGNVGAEFKKAGVSIDDIGKVMVGMGKDSNNKQDNMTVVVRFKKNPDAKKMASAASAKEEKHKDKTYYKSPTTSFYFPSDDLMVASPSEAILKKLIEKDNTDIVVSDDMKQLAKKVGGSTIWVATSDSIKDAVGGPAAMLGGGGGPAELKDALSGAKGGAFGVKVSSSTVSVEGYLLCKDSDVASKAADEINKKWKDKKKEALESIDKSPMGIPGGDDAKSAAKDAINSIDFSSSSSYLTFSASLKYKAFQDQVKQLPFGGMMR